MLNDYIASVDTIDLLTWEEEQRLWKAYEEEGDLEARMTIIEHYQPLVLKEANVYQSSKVDRMDCIQEGTIGLIEAVERYDSKKGVAFSLYAVHRIRGRILDYLRKEGKEGIVLQSETEDVGAECAAGGGDFVDDQAGVSSPAEFGDSPDQHDSCEEDSAGEPPISDDHAGPQYSSKDGHSGY